ncbi:transglycosylase domain-containing protein [Actinophytocola sp. NPDC049390]|uniref:transglycosylase domain-containing protein n=1 Tax=Actinophytocola sp. NPDC049390 TaxID=3363894 RepID=UPI00378F4477
MNDHRNHRYRESEPAWPSGDDPRSRGNRGEEAQERTGFWSPLWEDDGDDAAPARPSNGHSNGRPRHEAAPSNGRSGGSHARRDDAPQWPGADSGGGNSGGEHRWPDAEPPARPPAPPRPAPRSSGPVAWPSAESGAPAGRRPGGPHTPPPGANGFPNGAPGPAGARPPGGPGQATRVVRPRPAGPPRPGMTPPGAGPDGPTELLPPVHRGSGPEPELLTHREPDYDEDVNDDPDLYYDEDEDGPLSDEDRKRRRKKIWRRVRRTGYVMTAFAIITPIIGFFVAYQVVEVPDAKAVAAEQGQVVTLTYSKASGGKQLSQIVPPNGNRRMVTYEEIPDTVKHAVYAAEDAEFETNPGFDIGGVLRAGYNQVTGGSGGGSTITQQYIKKATGKEESEGLGGYTRKAVEVVKAYKMNNTYTKPQILTSYLNTIYLGRGANGISAAAKAWFGVDDLNKLTASQAALIAGMIQRPSQDSEEPEDVAYQQRRWKFVMDQMLDKGWVTAEERKAATFPKLIPRDKAMPKAVTGPGAHIQAAVLEEAEEAGYPLEELQQKGYRIQTTIDQRAQKTAQAAVNEVLKGQPKNLFPGMVVVNPKNGSVLAYYGGKAAGFDWAKARQEPGSSFKPFDLVALLEKGKGLYETYDGRTDRIFDGRKVRNSGGMSCGENCTVAEAMKKSINTVFYDIALNEVTTKKVAAAAAQAGITSPLEGENGAAPDANISIGGGKTRVSTYEMASAYATFASGGIYHKPHMIEAILGPDGKTVWKPDQETLDGKQAFDKDPAKNRQIARNVTESLLEIPEYSEIPCDDGRACAGKTGTHQFGATEDNAKAWMVGYTPQVSVAVSLAAEEKNKQVPLKDADGNIIYGSGLPGEIWQKFMNDWLKDAEKLTFGQFEPIGKPEPELNDDDDNGENRPSDNRPSDNRPTDNRPTGDRPPNSKPDETTETTTPEQTTTDETDPEGPGIPTIGGGGGGDRSPSDN